MSDLDSIVSVTISATGTPLSRDDFGTPLFVRGKGTAASVATYTKANWATQILADGYTTGDPVYLAAQAIFSASPCVPAFKVLTAGVKVVQQGSAAVVGFSTGTVSAVTVYRPDGTSATYTRTAPGSSSATAEAAALQALISAGETNLTVTNGTGTISWVTNNSAGDVYHLVWNSNFGSITQTTADPGYTTALTSALGLDTGWYGILLDCHSSALITAVAAWAESNGKQFVATTSNTLEITTSAGNIGASLKASAYTRTGMIWHALGREYPAAAWMSRMYATAVGAGTWNFKTLPGVTADTLTPTQIANLATNYTTAYITRASRAITQGGHRCDGDWMDTTRGRDALVNDMQIRVATVLMNSDKVPYDDDGLQMIGNEVLASLNSFTQKGNVFLTPGTPAVNVPAASSVSSTDRQTRVLNSITFSAQYASAVHTVNLNGTLSY